MALAHWFWIATPVRGRAATYEDWKAATRLSDSLDEIGMYWEAVDISEMVDGMGDFADHVCRVHRNFSKHVNDGIAQKQREFPGI